MTSQISYTNDLTLPDIAPEPIRVSLIGYFQDMSLGMRTMFPWPLSVEVVEAQGGRWMGAPPKGQGR